MRNKFSLILNSVGIMLVIVVMLWALPLSVPKLLGWKIYGVSTSSMEPEYSVGGVVYVQECDTSELKVGDVITFTLGSETDYVMTHRIAEIPEADVFITKGDANNTTDAQPVEAKRIIGKVTAYIPYLAKPASLLNTPQGICVLIIIFILAVICWLLADIVKKIPMPQISLPGKWNPVRILAVVMIVGAGIYLAASLLEYEESDSEYEALAELVFAENGNDVHTDESWAEAVQSGGDRTDVSQSDSLGEERDENHPVCNALAKLKEQYPDMIGWIVFDNNEISYPVMQTTDNEYYLEHTFSGEKNSAGSIFMEAVNHSTWQDAHTILYGHNMKNGSMFGKLSDYRRAEYYPGNEYFTVYTTQESFRYQIFAYYDVGENSDIYTVWYTPDDYFAQTVSRMHRSAYYDTDVDVTAEDKVLTLSTCSTEGNRFVVHAVRIEE